MKMICACLDGPYRQPHVGIGDFCAVCHAGPLPSEEEVRAQLVAQALAPLLRESVAEGAESRSPRMPREPSLAVREANWITVAEAARLLSISRRAVYAELERHPDGPLGQACSRLGRRLRFSRIGLDALLARPPLQRRVARGVVAPRVPSPTKGDR